VTKKPGSGRDQRQDPDPEEVAAATAANYRVDRVYAPARSTPRDTASHAAAALLASNRAATATTPPTPPTNEPADTEVSLRRQLSRLQRQLSEAQRELANKDDELAADVEMRHAISSAHHTLIDQHRALATRVDELSAYQARTAGVETRLLDCVTTAEQLAHDREREREQRIAAQGRVVELTAALEEAQARWMTERSEIEEQNAEEVARIEARKRLALDQAEEAITATTLRLREANDEQLQQLRDAHERSLSTLRGELEPKAVEAHELAEERERLIGEIAALESDAARDAADREQAFKRELAQLAEAHASERADQTRLHQAEMARAHDERGALTVALEAARTGAEQREQALEQAVAALHASHKKLQVEVAETKELCARLEADKLSSEERLNASAETTEALVSEKRSLRDQLETSEAEARRNALDRRRFVAYLEEGLALLGALPPSPDARDEDDESES
jgi:hypothetical protein